MTTATVRVEVKHVDSSTLTQGQPDATVGISTASIRPEGTAWYHFFWSHYQSTGGDQVMPLELQLSGMGFECWLDQKASTITKASMEAGVDASHVLIYSSLSHIACT